MNIASLAALEEYYYRSPQTPPEEPPPPTFHLNFDGVNDKITVPHATSINNLPLGDFTVEFVSKGFDLATGNVLAKTNGDDAGWQIYASLFEGSWYLIALLTFDNWGGSVSGISPAIDVTNSHHYEWSWNVSTLKFHLFIDGVEVMLDDNTISGTYTAYDNDSGNNLSIGFDEGASSSPLKFALNWLRVSNIVRHSSNFTPPSLTVCLASDANTVLRLALDEGTGTDAHDTSTNGNNGTISGATWEAD